MISWPTFSDTALRVLLCAQSEAELHQLPVEPEHILLALLVTPAGAGELLREYEITAQALGKRLPLRMSDVETSARILQPPSSSRFETRLSKEGEQLIKQAVKESRLYHHEMVTSHHLLRALLTLREPILLGALESREIDVQHLYNMSAWSPHPEQKSRYHMAERAQRKLLPPPSQKLNLLCALLPAFCWGMALWTMNFEGVILDTLLSWPLIAAPFAGLAYFNWVLRRQPTRRYQQASWAFVVGFVLAAIVISNLTQTYFVTDYRGVAYSDGIASVGGHKPAS